MISFDFFFENELYLNSCSALSNVDSDKALTQQSLSSGTTAVLLSFRELDLNFWWEWHSVTKFASPWRLILLLSAIFALMKNANPLLEQRQNWPSHEFKAFFGDSVKFSWQIVTIFPPWARNRLLSFLLLSGVCVGDKHLLTEARFDY